MAFSNSLLAEHHFAGATHTRLLVAASRAGEVVGTLLLQHGTDYFTGEPNLHIDVLAVAGHAEGIGVGSALMHAAESQAASSGARTMSLSVFEDNRRARRLYERRGFRADTIRYIKVLAAGDD